MFRYLKRIFSNIIEKNKTNTDKVKLSVSLIFVNRQNNIFCRFKGGICVLDKWGYAIENRRGD